MNGKSGICNNLEGWVGREVGRRLKWEETYVYLWLIHVDILEKPTQYCKAIILQLKISLEKRKQKKKKTKTKQQQKRKTINTF